MEGVISAIFVVVIVLGSQKLGIKNFIRFRKGQGVINTIISLVNLAILSYTVYMLSSGLATL